MNSRRKLLAAFGATTLAMPFRAFAQQPSGKIPRLGILLFNSPQIDPVYVLVDALAALGHVVGKTIVLEYRYAESKAERLPALAAELVELKPDLIFAYGGDVAPHVKRATSTIPIVALVSNDPVQSGLVASVSRPGGNVTGVTLVYDELAGKVLELLKEAVPEISRVGVLWNPDHADPEYRETLRAANAHKIQLQSLEVRRPGDFDGAFEAAKRERAEGMVIVSSRLLLLQKQKIVQFGADNRIIMAGTWADWAKDGLLLTYGPSPADGMRRIASYLDKVIRGARPADLPMERPARFDLTINQKAANTLGIKFPNAMLVRADGVIE
ncbi:ABC transporter substrate-binding protein [Bradyrhizobium sp. CCBAU 11357]|uniref:ABC transporter substrate-binding protein n=1 Tax=Bradyrhizobium sp. CCBAU 11357 TaxID=1630808 RepID=UPI0023020134|nr:ABC transporter substrate-binding protein [Bradyrhizobium sp. CCBAU 11357]